MRKELLSSLGVHFLIITVIVFFSTTTSKVRGYPTIYRVNLVTLPKATVTTETKVQTAKIEKPGLALKPVKKLTKKELAPHKEVVFGELLSWRILFCEVLHARL